MSCRFGSGTWLCCCSASRYLVVLSFCLSVRGCAVVLPLGTWLCSRFASWYVVVLPFCIIHICAVVILCTWLCFSLCVVVLPFCFLHVALPSLCSSADPSLSCGPCFAVFRRFSKDRMEATSSSRQRTRSCLTSCPTTRAKETAATANWCEGGTVPHPQTLCVCVCCTHLFCLSLVFVWLLFLLLYYDLPFSLSVSLSVSVSVSFSLCLPLSLSVFVVIL